MGLGGNPQPKFLVGAETHSHLGNESVGVTIKILEDVAGDL